jgi:ceramide glucosyltransferase
MPFALLAFVTALWLHLPWVATACLAWGLVTRMLLAGVVGRAVVGERSLPRTMLLFPLRDLMGFGFWLASYGSNRILWRGEEYILEKGGYMRSAHLPVVLSEGDSNERESALTT